MCRFSTIIVIALSTLLLVFICSAQQASTTAVPYLIRYSGTLKDAQGAVPSSPRVGAVGVTFAIYKQQDGGVPVWSEIQNVTTDGNGQYNIVLGGTTSTGVPDDLFSQPEQRWLGVQVQGQAEQERVLLVSVPYAFKAHEAETLGGLPASAFVKATPPDAESGVSVNAGSAAGKTGSPLKAKDTVAPAPRGPCIVIPGYLTYWDNTGALCASILFQVAGKIGIGTTTPSEPLDVVGDISTTTFFDILERPVVSVGAPASLASTNLFLGYFAGAFNSTGTNNTFSGHQAGFSNTTGHDNTFTGEAAAHGNTTGAWNTFTGGEVGTFHQTGDNNAFYGFRTGRNNTSGASNAFFGYQAGFGNNGNNNAFFGRSAGFSSSGNDNTFLGLGTGYYNQGSHNTFAGENAGVGTLGGGNIVSHNAFFGDSAGQNNTGGGGNTFLGDSAGQNTSNGLQNTFTGLQAGLGATTGIFNSGRDNTFTGYAAGAFTTTGSFNTYLGSGAGVSHTMGQENIFVGYQAGASSTTGSSNIYIGNPGSSASASKEIRIGVQGAQINQTYIAGIFTNPMSGMPVVIDATGHLGTSSGSGNVTGNCALGANWITRWTSKSGVDCSHIYEDQSNFFVGINHGTNPGAELDVNNGVLNGGINVTTSTRKAYMIGLTPVLNIFGTNNLFVGAGAGPTNTGSFNTFSGSEAGLHATTGRENTFSGYRAGYGNTSGVNNTGILNAFYGSQSGFSNTTGSQNVFSGYFAGNKNTQGTRDTFGGYVAGANNILGNDNTFYGSQSGLGNVNGRENTYLGDGAGGAGDGTGNTFVGMNSGGGMGATGSFNTILGWLAGSNASTGNSNLYIANPGATVINEANTIRIGTTPVGNVHHTNTYIAGIYTSAPGTSPRTVCVAPNGKLWGVASSADCGVSSRRFKEQILDMGDSSSKLFQLRPVTFLYKRQYDDGSHLLQYGLIAEEVAKVYPEMVAYEQDGTPFTVKYQLLAPMLLNELQKQQTVVAAQQDVIKTQQEQIQTQGQQIQDLQQRLLRLESLSGNK